MWTENEPQFFAQNGLLRQRIHVSAMEDFRNCIKLRARTEIRTSLSRCLIRIKLRIKFAKVRKWPLLIDTRIKRRIKSKLRGRMQEGSFAFFYFACFIGFVSSSVHLFSLQYGQTRFEEARAKVHASSNWKAAELRRRASSSRCCSLGSGGCWLQQQSTSRISGARLGFSSE